MARGYDVIRRHLIFLAMIFLAASTAVAASGEKQTVASFKKQLPIYLTDEAWQYVDAIWPYQEYFPVYLILPGATAHDVNFNEETGVADGLMFGVDDGTDITTEFSHACALTNGAVGAWVSVSRDYLVDNRFYAYYGSNVNVTAYIRTEEDLYLDFGEQMYQMAVNSSSYVTNGPLINLEQSEAVIGDIGLERSEGISSNDFFRVSANIVEGPNTENDYYSLCAGFSNLLTHAVAYENFLDEYGEPAVFRGAGSFDDHTRTIVTNSFYSWSLAAIGWANGVMFEKIKPSPDPVFTGEISMTVVTNAYEFWRVPGRVRLSLPDGIVAPADFSVRYSVGGYTNGWTVCQELPGRVTIPAGTNCAEIVVRPRHDPAVNNDVSITITIDPSSCHSDGGPASVTIHDNGGQVERGFSVIMR